jgi:hypothetical protein
MALRYRDWKVAFLEQNAEISPKYPQGVWTAPFTQLRIPKLYNLRSDPLKCRKVPFATKVALQQDSDYSITSSASDRTEFGTLMPSLLATFRLTINSNFVGCSTGKSAGFSPFRILSTKYAA